MAAHILAGRDWPRRSASRQLGSTVHSAAMRIVRDYFGLDRTTVTYDCEITGVGGDADSFYIVADLIQSSGRSGARTVVTLSHDEMARMLADYRRNCPIINQLPASSSLERAFARRGHLPKVNRIADFCQSVLRAVLRGKGKTL